MKKAPIRRNVAVNMHQGSGPKGGGADMTGNTRGIMHNGGSTPRRKAPTGKVGTIMHQ